MFYLQAYDIAKAEQAAREAQLKHKAKLATGLVRETKTSIVARMLAALHDALMTRRYGRSKRSTHIVTRGAPAR